MQSIVPISIALEIQRGAPSIDFEFDKISDGMFCKVNSIFIYELQTTFQVLVKLGERWNLLVRIKKWEKVKVI